jgi:hypothetical protein
MSETKHKPNSIPPDVSKAFQLLTINPFFITNLEASIKNILKDGKIDKYDIPEIIFLITNAYNLSEQVRIKKQDLPILIKLIYNYIVDKLDLIPNDKRDEFEELVNSALKLVMIQPAVFRNINSCLGKLFSCRKSSSSE